MATKKIDISWAFECVRNKCFDLVPKSAINKELLLSSNPQEMDGYFINTCSNTLIVEIIKNGLISEVPTELISKDLLTNETGNDNRIILMEFGKYGLLHLAPKQAITKRNILKQDAIGNSILYHTCATGELPILPKHYYTHRSLLRQNKYGRNCVNEAAKYGNLHLLPVNIIKQQNMIGSKPKEISPIDEFYTFCLNKNHNTDEVEEMLKIYTDQNLMYLRNKRLNISNLASKTLRLRQARKFVMVLTKKSKSLTI